MLKQGLKVLIFISILFSLIYSVNAENISIYSDDGTVRNITSDPEELAKTTITVNECTFFSLFNPSKAFNCAALGISKKFVESTLFNADKLNRDIIKSFGEMHEFKGGKQVLPYIFILTSLLYVPMIIYLGYLWLLSSNDDQKRMLAKIKTKNFFFYAVIAYIAPYIFLLLINFAQAIIAGFSNISIFDLKGGFNVNTENIFLEFVQTEEVGFLRIINMIIFGIVSLFSMLMLFLIQIVRSIFLEAIFALSPILVILSYFKETEELAKSIMIIALIVLFFPLFILLFYFVSNVFLGSVPFGQTDNFIDLSTLTLLVVAFISMEMFIKLVFRRERGIAKEIIALIKMAVTIARKIIAKV